MGKSSGFSDSNTLGDAQVGLANRMRKTGKPPTSESSTQFHLDIPDPEVDASARANSSAVQIVTEYREGSGQHRKSAS
jgi:hypothetical protein